MMLPIVTGMSAEPRNLPTLMSAPIIIALGMKLICATLCSKPMATKAVTGNHRARILPVMSSAAWALLHE